MSYEDWKRHPTPVHARDLFKEMPLENWKGRLLSGVDCSGSGCWEWRGFRDPRGYGKISIGGSCRLAHRAAWIINNGDIPNGLCVLHACDNPPCCRIDHLFLGTKGENNKDRAAKGRTRTGVRAGEFSATSKLTNAEVFEIRKMYAKGIFQKEIAKIYRITQSAVSRAVSGKRWGHI